MIKYASFEDAQVLDVKGSHTRSHTASIDTISNFSDYRTDDNYLYVRLRAISSRVNKNGDGWPSVELAGGPEIMDRHKQSSNGFTVEASDGNPEYGFSTFLGRPNFIDHNNSDPKRARGVVVDAKLRVLPIEKVAASGDEYWTGASLDPEHSPPTEVELLIEIDAKTFPKYAKAIRNGDLDGFSMGADVEWSKCSHCGHIAYNSDQYCGHIVMKGAHHDYKTADGKRISRRSYENCLTPSTPILLADHTYLPISDIQKGMQIIDHLGEPRKVDQVQNRYIDENILEIHRSGQGKDRPLCVTMNHPLLAIRGTKKELRKNTFEPEFIDAGDLREGDWVVETSPRHKGLLKRISIPKVSHDGRLKQFIPDSIELNEDFGRWCGWYLAEGSLAYRRLSTGERSEKSVEFSLHREETNEQNEILSLGKHLFGLEGKIFFRNNGATISFYNRPLAVFMSQLGTSSLTKSLPYEWLDGPIQFINGIVGAHRAGDGHDSDRYRPNEMLHSTSSPVLADQLYDMNIWLGNTPNRRLDKPSKINKRTVPGNIIVMPKQRQRTARGRIETDQWRLSKITEINHVKYSGRVYNFEVADTHTYIANGQAVHNCFRPKFFEISGVFDPADETALAREIRSGVEHEGSVHTAENPLPQSFETSAPEEVDTMRQEHRCPVCAETMDGETCDVCFLPGTLIRTKAGYIPIEDIVPGDEVLGESGEFNPVMDTVVREWHGRVKKIDGPTLVEPIYVTPNHPFKSDNGKWTHAGCLSSKSKVAGYTDNLERTSHRLEDVKNVNYDGLVYNLKVANDPTYTVHNLTAHNCGYVEPPKGMDNPDLTKAKELQQADQQAAGQNVQQDVMGQPSGGQPMPPPGGPEPHTKQPGSFLQTRKSSASASVMSDMRWQPKLDPKLAARINQFEKPLTTSTKPGTNEPAQVTVVKNPQQPVTSAMRTAQDLIEAAKTNHQGDTMSTTHTADGPTGPEASPDARVDVTGVGGVIEPSNDAASKADAQVDVTGVGSTGVTDVEAEKTESLPTASETSDDSGFDATKTVEDSGPTSTFGDSDGTQKGVSDPVTGDSLEGNQNKGSSWKHAYDAKPFYDQPGLSGGSANKGTEPTDPVGKAQDRVDVLSPASTPDNNSGPTSQWTGTDGNKIYRQQDPVTNEVSDMQFDGFTSHFVSAFKLADLEAELGLIEKDEKYDRLATLQDQSDGEIAAQMDMLSRVKTAGTKKLAQQRTAGVTRMPGAFGKVTASTKRFAGDVDPGPETVEDDVADAALFSR